MPCACKIPYETYPEAKDWGPVLWTILHAIAERVGTCPFPKYQPDERRGLQRLFLTIGRMIPCASCKEHYEVFLKDHPVANALKTLPYADIRHFVRNWFWELHTMVNESKGVAPFPFSSLESTYRSANIRMAAQQLKKPMQRAIKVAGKLLVAYQEFHGAVLFLLSLYGI